MKRIFFVASALAFVMQASAQAPVDSLATDNSDFAFTESQLDEDNDALQVVPTVAAKNDPYLQNVGFRFSSMRFKVRAYDNQYQTTYINGLQFSDAERGSFNYSMIGGLNDATRNREGLDGYEFNNYGIMGIGGGSSINMRASQIAQGNKVALSACNRNYVGRVMYTHGTGILNNGWAFAGSIGYRGAPMGWGNVEGTFYNGLSYYLAAEKLFNQNNSLSLVTFGAPTERAQQGASTEEAYWLAGSHYYNPNWGYQNGKKRNSRIVNSFDPTLIATWDWKNDDRSKALTTNFAFDYNLYSTTALGWGGDAYDPRPDYYKNLPSGIFDVYDETKNNPTWLEANPFALQQWNDLVNYWQSDKANRQINWDRMYYVNSQSRGGEALYYLERRHSNQLNMALSSTFKHTIDQHQKYAAGVDLRHTTAMHYTTMADLLGADHFTDVSKFAVNDYGAGSDEAQVDLLHPNRQVKEGDIFNNHYELYINKAKAWANYQYTARMWQVLFAGHIDGTTLERNGLMENGLYKNNSYGSSGVAKFLGGGGKATVAFTPNVNHRLALSVSATSKAPLARNSFVAPRVQNNFVNNLTNEDVFTGDLSYNFRFGPFSGKVSAYAAYFENQVEQTAYYNDQQSTFTYLTMTGINKKHYGVEAAFEYQATQHLSFSLMGTIADAQYDNNPMAQVNYEGQRPAETAKLNTCLNPITGEKMPLQVIAKGMRVSGTPLAAASFAIKYNINYWFFEVDANYFGRSYLSFSPYRRLNSTYQTAGKFYTASYVDANGNPDFGVTADELDQNGGICFDQSGNIVSTHAAGQEEFKGGFMLDASIGKSLRLKKGKTMSINLNLTNLTNNTNMKTGGYEQNRDDNYYTESGGVYTKGEGKAYKFSKNPKYYYAFPFNFFLNIGIKF